MYDQNPAVRKKKNSLWFISPGSRLISRCEAEGAKHKIKLFRTDFNQRKQTQGSITSCWSDSNHWHRTVEWRWFAGRRSEMTSQPAYGSFCWLLEFRGSALKHKTGNEEPQSKTWSQQLQRRNCLQDSSLMLTWPHRFCLSVTEMKNEATFGDGRQSVIIPLVSCNRDLNNLSILATRAVQTSCVQTLQTLFEVLVEIAKFPKISDM